MAPAGHMFCPHSQCRRVVNNFAVGSATFKQSETFQISFDAMAWPVGMTIGTRTFLLHTSDFQEHYRSVAYLYKVVMRVELTVFICMLKNGLAPRRCSC